jgi:DNA-binding CsgD family transcriptional regulator
MGVLTVWGLDDEAEAIYRSLLRNPGRDVARLAHSLDRDEAAVRRGLTSLQSSGLARREARGRYVANPPTAALVSLLRGDLAALEGRRTELDAVRASLPSFAADHLAGQSRGWSKVPFELLSDEEAFVAVEDLQRSTTGEVLACHRVDNLDVDTPAYVDLVQRQLAASRPMRALYPAQVVDDPRKLAYVRSWSAAGEKIRLLAQSPPSFAVFGDDVAIVSSQWEGLAGSKILVHAPALVALVRQLFERYWERALPVSFVGDEQRVDAERQILELLMLGAKDETIARHLDVSLRTVRRRVAEIMDGLGAGTRFQAGVEAARRGLL